MEPKEVVDLFLCRSRQQWEKEAERSLRQIANLSWWGRLWKAKGIAEETLGIGKYWNAGFGKVRHWWYLWYGILRCRRLACWLSLGHEFADRGTICQKCGVKEVPCSDE